MSFHLQIYFYPRKPLFLMCKSALQLPAVFIYVLRRCECGGEIQFGLKLRIGSDTGDVPIGLVEFPGMGIGFHPERPRFSTKNVMSIYYLIMIRDSNLS